MPRKLQLAAVLSAEGLSFVLVGSAALRLHGEMIPVADIDIVPEPGPRNIARLHEAMTALAVRHELVAPLRSLFILHAVSLVTSYGNLDCLLERGRSDWHRLRAAAQPIWVNDVSVMVASAADTRALRSGRRDLVVSVVGI